MRVCNSPAPRGRLLASGVHLLWQKSAKADSFLPVLRRNEQKFCHRL